MARPKRQFTDEELQEIERLARLNCKTQTISDALQVPYMTLKRSFGRRLTNWRALGRTGLKTKQYAMADTSPQMAIWLGKQDLGQVDKQTIATEQVESKSKTGKELKAAQAAAKAYNEIMSREPDKPKIVPITGRKGA